MNRKLWALALCALALVPSYGQQKETSAPTIKSRAELVLIPVIVTQDGTPATGLTAKDFVVLHNGRSEKVEVFEEIEATPAKVEPAILPPHTVQNYAAANRHQDVVILLLDFLNGSWSSRARIRSYLGDMARQFAQTQTPVTVLVLSAKGLVQVHSFTSDLGNLTKAVERRSSGLPIANEATPNWSSPFSPMGGDQTSAALSEATVPPGYLDAAKLDQAEMTLSAIQQIAEAYRGIPGRKKLIWMSIGFPSIGTVSLDSASVPARARPPIQSAASQFQIEGMFGRSWKSLSNANITVYPIDSNGVTNPTWESEFSAQHAMNENDRRMPPVITEIPTNTQSLLQVAQRTGGQNCTLLPTECLGKVLADGTHYYLLGFYLHGENKPGWHKLKVEVKRPNARVRARDGFMVGTNAQPTAEKDQKGQTNQTDKAVVLTALASPLDYTSVPLQMSWSAAPAPTGEVQLELLLISPPGGISVSVEESRINVDYLAFVRPFGKTDGQSFPVTLTTKLTRAEQASFAKTGFLFRKKIPLAPGRYEVRVFLRDNVAQKMGTVSTLVDLSAVSEAITGEAKP